MPCSRVAPQLVAAWSRRHPAQGAFGPHGAIMKDVDRLRTPAAEAPFADTLARFSRHLESRAAGPGDPAAAARARQDALRAYDRDRRRRLVVFGSLVVAAVAGLAVPLGLALAPSPEPPFHAAAAPIEPAPPVVPVAPAPVAELPVAPLPAAPPPPAAVATPLERADVREVQAKLRGFGFDPGPIDGDAGPRTLAAARQYRESRNQPQSEEIDRALLDQLRLDPAPVVVAPVQVAQRGRRAGPTTRGGSRPANPFDRLGRWLDSLVR